jgi:prepilin-type N-terminal cleavage/methylation domain-containing protein
MKAIMKNRGFTMIELLMVIVIIAVLSAMALPQFLDFQKEGKAAAIQQALATYRTAIKLQTQQTKLRCNFTGSDSRLFTTIEFPIFRNDITVLQAGPLARVCLTTDLPNPVDRQFIDLPPNQGAHRFTNGVDMGPGVFRAVANPFALPTADAENVLVYQGFDLGAPATADQVCTLIDQSIAILRTRYHWMWDQASGQIFAGTNTPGIRECAF